MTTKGPFALVRQMAAIFHELGVRYALGGSMASSLIGEPRSTVDVDIAAQLDVESGEMLLDRVAAEFYVPVDAARSAIAAHSSFNLLDNDSALKVDIFVLGDNLLDRMQIERSVLIVMPGAPEGVWVTSAEDQVLRKLDRFRQGGGMSDRQWRDVVGILSVGREALDLDDLRDSARVLALSELLDEALRQSNSLEDGRDPDLR